MKGYSISLLGFLFVNCTWFPSRALGISRYRASHSTHATFYAHSYMKIFVNKLVPVIPFSRWWSSRLLMQLLYRYNNAHKRDTFCRLSIGSRGLIPPYALRFSSCDACFRLQLHSSYALPAPKPTPTNAGHALRRNRRTEKTTPNPRPRVDFMSMLEMQRSHCRNSTLATRSMVEAEQ